MTRLHVLLFSFLLTACGARDSNREPLTEVTADGPISEKEVYAMLAENPEAGAEQLKKLAQQYRSQNDWQKAGTTYLNLATVYTDRLQQQDSALVMADRSIEICRYMKDTTQEANVLKYKGLLLGRVGRLKEAETAIAEAIALFEAVDFKNGVVISHFNLARVYFLNERYEASSELLQNCTNYWRAKGKKDRIFTDNLFGIELYCRMGEFDKASAMIAENAQLKDSIRMNDWLENELKRVVHLSDSLQNLVEL